MAANGIRTHAGGAMMILIFLIYQMCFESVLDRQVNCSVL